MPPEVRAEVASTDLPKRDQRNRDVLFHRAPAYPQLAGLCDVLKAPASSARKMQEVCHLREARDEAPLSAREVSQLVERAVYPA